MMESNASIAAKDEEISPLQGTIAWLKEQLVQSNRAVGEEGSKYYAGGFQQAGKEEDSHC